MSLYPSIRINLITSAKTDFYGDEIDISFEFNTPEDSSIVARKIGTCPWAICAAPTYLEKYGEPGEPHELKNHNCCIMVGEQAYDSWKFKEGPRNYSVKVEGNFYAAAFLVLKSTLNGLGIAQLPHYLVAEPIKCGSLVALFSDIRPHFARDIYIAYPHRTQTKKIRAFIDFAVNYLQKQSL